DPCPAVVVVPAPQPDLTNVFDDCQELVLEGLTREQVLDWRNHAAAGHRLVFDRIGRYGETSAQCLFTRAFRRDRAATYRPRAPGPRLHHLGAGVSGGAGVGR
ncbi:hypothetical protein, partial [Streptomyces sp. NPDC048425]|uniref:hypothetical protein n=1 Tax=Streptomyces sp. NPDC048425 TaxID=3365548 RepID=UPI00371D8654